MSPDPLNYSQREALDAALAEQAKVIVARSEAWGQIRNQEKTMNRWILVAFFSLCLSAILLVLYVRARYETKAVEAAPIYCVLAAGEWICGDDPDKLEAQADPPAPPSSLGVVPTAVIL